MHDLCYPYVMITNDLKFQWFEITDRWFKISMVKKFSGSKLLDVGSNNTCNVPN
jgi:hypothetical protein